MRQASSVLYVAIDDLADSHGSFLPGFDDFTASLDRVGIPAVWLSARTRLQLDEPRRKLGHAHPFVAEDGCGVFLPEDYFHLRPHATPGSRPAKSLTVRLGRFTCLPVAEQQPAASEALESLADEAGVAVVPLESLSPRELAQNLGTSQREAELARQRDFDELFFFAGATEEEVQRVHELARGKGWQLRQRGALWSLAAGASVARCVRDLSKLYDRALHAHVRTIALGVGGQAEELAAACDRAILLTASQPESAAAGRVMELPIRGSEKWDAILQAVSR